MEPPFQVVKVSDEGSTSPFIAHLFSGLLHFRDQFHLLGVPPDDQSATRQAFDTSFKPLIEAAQAARDAAVEVRRLVAVHAQAITSGQAVRFRPNQYDILQNIDAPLGQTFDKLIDQAIVATKGALQPFLKDILLLDIGFFFQKDPQFMQGVADLHAQGENALASYLEAARSAWHSALQDLRSKHEHEGWTLPRISYGLVGPQSVGLRLPTVLGLPVDEYAQVTANRVLLLIENMVVHGMLRKCPYPLFVVEIPPEQRDPMNTQRFRLAPRGLDPSPPWEIHYSEGNDFL